MATKGGRIQFQVGLNVETKSIQSLKTTLQNLQKIRPVDFGGTREELKQVQKTATQVEEALRKAFNINLGSLNIGKFNTELQKINGGLDGVYRQFSKLGGQGQTAFSEIAKTALTSNFQLKETNSLIQQMGTTLVNTIKWNIASSAINSFTQGVQSAFTYVKSLDAALTDIRIVTGDSQQKMQQFAASANKAAQALGRSTMDYTKSALTFYQQGLSDEDVAVRTEAVLKAQNITGTGAEMADYMTAVWNGYKVANEQAELYVDKLAAVADSSASDMSQLAIAMSRVASTANNMGVDVDQLNAQIATVVATTRQAPESVGTAFKTIYTRLNDIKTGADEAEISLGNYSGKMASIGFNVLDTNGRLRDTGQIMEEIGERWQTLTKEQQIYLATTMGGQRQVNQLMALFNNWTTYSELLNVSLESEGTLAEKNSRYMESLGAKMNQFAAAQERVKTAMIDTDSWKSALEILTSITNLFGSFVESIGGGGNALLAFGSIFMQVFSGPISQQLNSIITNLKTIQQNSERKEADIAMTQLFGKSAGYENQAVQQMVAAKREIQQYYSFISAEEANAYNEIVKQVGATSQQVDKVKSLKVEVENFQEGIKKAGETLGVSFETALENAGDVIEKLQGQIKDVSITDFVSNTSSGENFYRNLYGQLSAAIGENTAVPALKELKTLLEEDVLDFGKLQRAARNALNQSSGLLKQDLDIIQKEVKQASADFELADGQKKRFLENVDSQAFTRAILDVVSATGQLAAGFNSLKNVVTNVWGNENLSAGEKILQTITSLSFAIPSLVGAYNKLKIAISSTTLSEEASTMASIVNYRQKVAQLALTRKVSFQETLRAKAAKGVTATQAEQAMMTDLSTAADMRKAQADAAVAAQAELTAASVTTLNLALGAVAGIAIVFTVLQKYKQHIEAVKQAAEDFKEKTKGIAQNGENNKNTIQELKDLEQEYNRLSEKAGNYDTNISKLTDSEKARWDEIKNKIASANPDIVGAYNAQGQAILNNNDALKETIKLLEEKNTKELESYVNGPEFKKAREGRKQLYKQQKQEVNDLESKASTAGRFSGETLLSWQSLTNKENALGVAEKDTKDIKRLDELRKASLQELAANREQYDAQFKELLAGLKNSDNDDIKRLVAANEQRFLEAWNARVDIAGDLAAQMQAAKDKLNAVDDANPQAIMMELMVGKQDSAGYKALQDAGVKNAQSYVLAYLQGHKEGRVNEEPQLKEEAKNFEDQLLNLFRDNKNLETTLNSLNEEYKKQTFNTAQERVEWIADAINRAMKNLTIDENTQEAFITVLNAALGLNLNQSSFDFASKDGKFIKSISDPIISAADKARAEIQAKTGDEIDLGEILGFSNTGDVNWELIASQIAKCDLNSENWRDVLIDIISKQHEIAQNQSLITSLSSITQTGQKLQSGKSVSAKEQTAYRQNLDTIIKQEESKGGDANQQLIADAELLKQTWLAGSAEYEQALARVQRALIDTAAAQTELEGRVFTDEERENIQKYATTIDRVQDLWNRGIINDQIHYHALLDKAISNEIKTLKRTPEALKLYYENLKKTKKAINEFGEEIELTDSVAKEMAINDFKLIDSLEKLKKSYKNLKDDLAKDPGSIAFTNAISELVSIINNIPGIHIDLTEENATTYLEDVKNIAQGAEGAVEKLRQKLASQEIEKIKVQAGIDADSDADKILNELNAVIQEMSPDDIQTHAYLEKTSFVNLLNSLIRDCGLTADQCNRILSKIGAKANIKWETLTIDTSSGSAGDFKRLQYGQVAGTSGGKTTIKYPHIISYEPLNSTNDGGDIIDSGSSGGKGGGGGGSQGKQLSKKDQKKEDLDPYHDINRQLEKINKQYTLLQKNEEKLVGTDVIDNLNQQNKLLDKNIDLLKQKYGIGEEERKKKAEKLAPQGVEFDENGEVTNYNAIRQKWLDEYNELIKEWNKLAEEKTILSDEEKKQKEEELKEAEKKLEENRKNLDDYLEHLDTQADVQLQIKEEEEKKIQNEIKKFKIKIDLHIDYSEALREWRDFEDKVIDQLRDDDIFGNIESRFKNIFTYFEAPQGMNFGLIQHLTDQVTKTMDEIDKIRGGGLSDIYGNNLKQAAEDVNQYSKQIQSALKEYVNLINEIKQAYFDLANAADQAFDMQQRRLQALSSWIEHDKRLIELLYGEKAFDKISALYDRQIETNQKQLSLYKDEKDFWWARMQEEKARMQGLDEESNAYKEAKARYEDAEKRWLDSAENFKSKLQESAQAITDKFHNAIDKIIDDLGKKLTGGKGLQPLAEEWQLVKKAQDQYLDDVDKIYQVDKLENAVKDAMKANQGNPKAQQALNKFMQERVDLLKEQDKLSQYDIDHANKAFEIQLKRIALQDSRANKTKLRLRRDSQGNYSYQFVADEEEAQNKVQQLKDLQNELYHLDKDSLRKFTDEYSSEILDMFNKLKEISKSGLSEEDKEAQLQALRERYQPLISGYQKLINQVKDNIPGDLEGTDIFSQVLEKYGLTEEALKSLSDTEQNQVYGKIVPGWNSGISEMIDIINGEGGLEPVFIGAIEKISAETEKYNGQINTLLEDAGITLEELGTGLDDTTIKTQSLVEANKDVISTYEDEFEKMGDVLTRIDDLSSQYDNLKQAAIEAAKAVQQLNRALAAQESINSSEDEDEDETGPKGFINTAKSKIKTSLSNAKELIKSKVSRTTATKTLDDNGFYANSWDTSQKPGDVPDSNISNKNDQPIQAIIMNEDDGRRKYYDTDSNYTVESIGQNKIKIRRKSSKNKNGLVSNDMWESIDTGGYTGEWGSEGRVALLHEKELVLNKEDTANILAAVNLMRHLNSSLNPGLSNFSIPNLSSSASNSTSIDQNVKIEASFPNVQDHNEIEQALNNLINRASQYAFNTDK